MALPASRQTSDTDTRTNDADRVRLFSVNVDRLSQAQAVDQIMQWADQKTPHTVITPNLDHMAKLPGDPLFQSAYDAADLVLADGMPLVWLSRLEGAPLPERVTGSDLILPVCARAAQSDKRIFLMGSTVERLTAAKEALQNLFPALVISGIHAPPFGFDKDELAQEEAVNAINEAGTDLAFVALGAPKQEVWCQAYRKNLHCGVLMNIGAGLDFLTGDVKRAPEWMQKTGLEWVWRAASEPARLGPRYAKLLWQVPGLIAKHRRTR
ncbi:MAG: WecB/TagA/CpsF family glycosyltransferase [Pseudomonadota bacterium]